MRKEFPSIIEEGRRLLRLPDLFNSHYRPRGWIAAECTPASAMERAVELAEKGNLDAGEEAIAGAYDSDFLKLMTKRLWVVETFESRRHLLEEALQDHLDGRYHASVPVVLAQIDGIVYDLVNNSFYKRGTASKLHAADSLAGHPEGLAALAKEMGARRPKTTKEITELPYRNGILHGRDLGYATPMNSTKAFASLLALRDWALRVQMGTTHDEPPIQWLDVDEANWDDMKRVWKDALREMKKLAEARNERQP